MSRKGFVLVQSEILCLEKFLILTAVWFTASSATEINGDDDKRKNEREGKNKLENYNSEGNVCRV